MPVEVTWLLLKLYVTMCLNCNFLGTEWHKTCQNILCFLSVHLLKNKNFKCMHKWLIKASAWQAKHNRPSVWDPSLLICLGKIYTLRSFDWMILKESSKVLQESESSSKDFSKRGRILIFFMSQRLKNCMYPTSFSLPRFYLGKLSHGNFGAWLQISLGKNGACCGHTAGKSQVGHAATARQMGQYFQAVLYSNGLTTQTMNTVAPLPSFC